MKESSEVSLVSAVLILGAVAGVANFQSAIVEEPNELPGHSASARQEEAATSKQVATRNTDQESNNLSVH